MKLSFIPVVIIASCACFAQTSSFSVRGHALGEDIHDFLSKSSEPNTERTCEQYVASHKVKEGLFINSKQMDINSEIKRCSQILSATRGQTAKFFIKNFGDVEFREGKLVAFTISFLNNLLSEDKQIPYEKVREDAVARYGTPQEEGNTSWQNGFGAQFHPRYCQWVTKNKQFILRIEEMPKDADHLNANVVVHATSSSAMNGNYKDETAGPNVFDK